MVLKTHMEHCLAVQIDKALDADTVCAWLCARGLLCGGCGGCGACVANFARDRRAAAVVVWASPGALRC